MTSLFDALHRSESEQSSYDFIFVYSPFFPSLNFLYFLGYSALSGLAFTRAFGEPIEQLPVPLRPPTAWKKATTSYISPPPPPSGGSSSSSSASPSSAGLDVGDFFAAQSNTFGIDSVKPDVETFSHGTF